MEWAKPLTEQVHLDQFIILIFKVKFLQGAHTDFASPISLWNLSMRVSRKTIFFTNSFIKSQLHSKIKTYIW